MSVIKITEKETAEQVKNTASVLITQPEEIDGSEIESLRRASLESFISVLKSNGLVSDEDLSQMFPNLVKKVESISGGIKVTYWDDVIKTFNIAPSNCLTYKEAYESEKSSLQTGQVHVDDATSYNVIYLLKYNNGTNKGFMICAAVNANAYMKMQIRALHTGELSYRTKDFSQSGSEWTSWVKFESEANKANYITNLNKGSSVLYPTIKAVVDYIDGIIQALDTDTVMSIESVEGGIKVTYRDYSEEFIKSKSEGLSFDGGYVDDDNNIHFTQNGEDIAGFTPFELPASGGTGPIADSTIRITNGMSSRTITAMSTVEQLLVLFSWGSVDSSGEPTVGDGTVSWTINNVKVATQSNVPQGNVSFDVRPYLTAGRKNDIMVTVEDVYGTQKPFTWSITLSNVGLVWNLSDIAFHGNDSQTVRIEPSGVGEKVITVEVDGVQIFRQEQAANSNRVATVTIPAQDHGAHIVEANMAITIDGSTVNVPTLVHTGIWTEEGVDTPVVAIHKKQIEATQFETVEVKYMVYDPTKYTSDITLMEGQTEVSSRTVDRSVQPWEYIPATAGTVRLSVACGSSSDYVDVVAESIGYEIEPITTDLIMDLDPTGHSNTEANRENFGYKDANGSNHALTFSNNFDWINGGFQKDEEGVTAFVVKRGTSVTFDRSLFLAADNTNGELGRAGTGKHISFIFKTVNVTDYDTQIAHSFDSGVGIRLFAHNASFQAGNTIECPYCEKKKIEMSLNIDPTKSSMKFWLAGTPAKGTTFLTGNIKTQFVQGTPDAFTIGSDDCDVWVYRFKMYKAYLLDSEIMQNFIADCRNVKEMLARYLRNDIYDGGNISIEKLMKAAPQLHIITIETEGFPADKGSSGNTPCKIIHQIGNGIDADQWYAENALYTLQGTSSMNYRQCAGNLDINMKKTTMKVSKTQATLNGYAMTENSIPVKYFNLKANVASSEHANNVCAADLFNTYNPLISMAKSLNPKVRDTVEGHPCAVFIKNTGETDLLLGVSGARSIAPGETILYFAGDMNNSKKNTEVFGQTGEWDDEDHQQCCIEFLENTYTRCTFKTSDFENEGWKEDGTSLASHFEFRYPDGEGTQAMKDRFIEMHNWVHSTDPTAATGTALPKSEWIGSLIYDTEEYRKTKFRTQVENYFDLDNLIFYYLFTEFFLAVDNRAKNMFLSYEPDENGVWKWNVSKNYDDDTILGIDNKGQFRWEDSYAIEDTDGYEEVVDGQTVVHPYFNAAESVLWCNLRDCFPEKLRTSYSAFESAGLFRSGNIIRKFSNYQRIRPEALVIEDYSGKYDAPIVNAGNTSWMENMEHGEKRPQLIQFTTYRELFMSSKYYSARAAGDLIVYQAMPGANFSSLLELKPYSTMYAGFLRDNSPAGHVRLKKGQTGQVQCLDGNGNPFVLNSGEVNVQLINGSNLMHVGGAAYLYPGQVNINNGEKLQDLLLGGTTYTSNNLKSLSFDVVPLVKVVDLRGQSGIFGNIDLTKCVLLEELYLGGTGGTEVYLPSTESLTKAILGSNVTKLHAIDVPNLDDFSCSSGNLTELRVENAPGIDAAELLSNASKLIRGRITNVNWSFDNADLLMRLTKLKGIAEDGNPIETVGSFYLSGSVYIDKITQDEWDTINDTFDTDVLTVRYGEIVPAYTVTFKNYDGTVLNTQTVRRGAAAVNPISNGLIVTPTKPPTVEETFVFSGWDSTITNITADKSVTAVFSPMTRYYNVSWWYDSTTLLYTERIEAHGSSAYDGEDLTPPSGQYWLGWDRPVVNVVSDVDVMALFVQPTEPINVAANKTYIYSDDPADADDIKYTLAELMWIYENAHPENYNIRNGDLLKVSAVTNAFADTSFIFKHGDFDHCRLADGTKFAKSIFHMVGVMNATYQMNSSNTNVGGCNGCKMDNYLENTVFPAMPRWFQILCKLVQRRSSIGNTSSTIDTYNRHIFLLTYAEVGFGVNEVPYKNEVDPEARNITLPIYTDNASRIKKHYNGEGSAEWWWLASPLASSASSFTIVNSGGYAYGNAASGSAGVAWGFCL